MGDTPSLIGALVRDTGELVVTQGELLRAELREAGDQAKVGLVMLVIGAVLGLVALGVLAACAVLYLTRFQIEADVACAIIGGGVIVIAALLVIIGSRRLQPSKLMPNRTLRQISRTLEGRAP